MSSASKSKQSADPFKTRTGKTRLGPLNYSQLEALLEKEIRPKIKAQIRNRMARMTPPNICTSETIDDTV